jgi:hypothetical protein
MGKAGGRKRRRHFEVICDRSGQARGKMRRAGGEGEREKKMALICLGGRADQSQANYCCGKHSQGFRQPPRAPTT